MLIKFRSFLNFLRATPRQVLFLWIATFVVLIITFLVTYYQVSRSPQTVALHYNVVIGVDVLGHKNRLYQIPLTAVLIAAVNLTINRFLSQRERFLSSALAAISLVSALALLAAVILLGRIN
jgi:uncharacterized membrane protein